VIISNSDGHIPSGQTVQRAVVEDTGIGMFHVYKCTEREQSHFRLQESVTIKQSHHHDKNATNTPVMSTGTQDNGVKYV